MSLVSQVSALATRIGTEFKTVRTEIAAKPSINDASTSNTATYSSTKTESRLTAVAAQVKSDLVNGAGAALDTFKELQDALGNDANFATTISTALGKRVRVDAAQAFTAPETQQARDNILVYSRAEVGDPTTDFVAVFVAALA